jgi:hypothetical protein
MTTPNLDHLSRGWALIAEGAQYLSMAYASNDAGAEALPPPPSSAPVPSFDELPPTGFDEPLDPLARGPALNPQVEAGLGKCPVHGKPWSVKAAGVSKAGAPYDAFYKCDSKDGDEFCKQKPQKIWRDLHPIPGAAAA